MRPQTRPRPRPKSSGCSAERQCCSGSGVVSVRGRATRSQAEHHDWHHALNATWTRRDRPEGAAPLCSSSWRSGSTARQNPRPLALPLERSRRLAAVGAVYRRASRAGLGGARGTRAASRQWRDSRHRYDTAGESVWPDPAIASSTTRSRARRRRTGQSDRPRRTLTHGTACREQSRAPAADLLVAACGAGRIGRRLRSAGHSVISLLVRASAERWSGRSLSSRAGCAAGGRVLGATCGASAGGIAQAVISRVTGISLPDDSGSRA